MYVYAYYPFRYIYILLLFLPFWVFVNKNWVPEKNRTVGTNYYEPQPEEYVFVSHNNFLCWPNQLSRYGVQSESNYSLQVSSRLNKNSISSVKIGDYH